MNSAATMRGIPEERRFDAVPGGVIRTEFTRLVLEHEADAIRTLEVLLPEVKTRACFEDP